MTSDVQGLLFRGSKQLVESQKREADQKKSLSRIKYFASQIVGTNNKAPKVVETGSRLLGFLLTAIDTREPSLVSVLLPHGGTSSSGVEISQNSVVVGNFSYRGSGDKVTLSFSKLNTPDGDRLSIAAVGLDAADYTAGVRGKAYSDNNFKLAGTLGLTMTASMTDVLTERESIGNGFGTSVEAKPTMKNALLQGVSSVAKDQAGRISDQINSTQDYVFIPKGKEVIVQLTEDYQHD